MWDELQSISENNRKTAIFKKALGSNFLTTKKLEEDSKNQPPWVGIFQTEYANSPRRNSRRQVVPTNLKKITES